MCIKFICQNVWCFFILLLSRVLTLYLVPIKVEDGAVRKEGKRWFVGAVRKTCRGW